MGLDLPSITSLVFTDATHTSAIVIDLDKMDRQLAEIRRAFPPNSLHAVACKANPLTNILKRLAGNGFGTEVASLGELQMALRAGFLPENIVFDSPAKTQSEITFALDRGINLNIDSISEWGRVKSQIGSSLPIGHVGIRINPEVGEGKIASTSVAGSFSKFGIGLDDHRGALRELYQSSPWLDGVHLHIGSQGMSLEMLVKAVRKVLDFVLEIDPDGKQIRQFDIGGGLGVQYADADPEYSVTGYAEALRENCPELYEARFRLVTEFGRYVFAATGMAISRVEYIKESAGKRVAIIHLGADLLLRKCYNPQDWHHKITVLDVNGSPKDGARELITIAGPLCFSGDIVERDILLPVVKEGDFICIHDIGAYTFSMWSRYNSRQMPLVVGYSESRQSMETIKAKESLEDIWEFWS